MLPRMCGNLIRRAVSPGSRALSVVEREDKGTYLLKIGIDPFSEKDSKVTMESGVVRITGKRGENTGNSNWSHEMHQEFQLPKSVKLETAKVKYESGSTVVVTAETN